MSICSRVFAACSLALLTSAGAFGASVFPGVVRTSAGEADFTIELTPEEYAQHAHPDHPYRHYEY